MRRTPLLALAVLGLLVLSGCFKVDADFTVNDDETVDGTMIVAVEQEFLDLMGELGGEDEGADDLVDTEDLPEGAEVEAYEAGGYVGQKVTFEGVSLEEMTSSMAEGQADSDEWSLTHEGDEYVFEATFDMSTAEDEMDMSAMMKDAEISISMTFPGEVTESNGEIDGHTVTWEPEIGEANEMRAVAADESGFPVAPVVGGVIGLAMLAGIGVFLLRSRRGTASTTDPAEPGQPGQPDASPDLEPRT